jgi:ribose-phosphate pyrophosphokinase
MDQFVSPYLLQIFVFGNNHELGNSIAELLKQKPAKHTTTHFPDGERLSYQKETVRDRDVFIVFTSQNGDAMDANLIDYLRFVRAVKEGQPHKITIILPKLPHQRQDVENRKLRQPVLSNFFPELFKTAGADRIVVCRLHNPASKTTDPPMENVQTDLLIVKEIKARYPDLSEIAIAAGDIGGAANARDIADQLGGLPTIIVEKNRNKSTNLSKPMTVFTDDLPESVTTVIFIDDLISTANTLSKAADALYAKHSQITNYVAVATHPDFIAKETHAKAKIDTLSILAQSRFQSIWVTDTIPVADSFKEGLLIAGKEFATISVAKLIAQTIDNLHNGKSVSSLWTTNGEVVEA